MWNMSGVVGVCRTEKVGSHCFLVEVDLNVLFTV